MPHHRLLVIAALGSTSALALGACVADTGTSTPDSDAAESTGNAEEAVTDPNENITIPLPYENKHFELRNRLDTKRFVLTAPTSITVVARASWSSPGICRVSQYTVMMVNADGKNEGSKNYLINDRDDIQSFQNVPPGKHYLHLEVQNPAEPHCVLSGDMTIKHTS